MPIYNSKLRICRTLLAISTILCSGVAVPAFAQSIKKSSASEVDTVDENGIDLLSLRHVNQHEDISIGKGQFPDRLSVTRIPAPDRVVPKFGSGNISDLHIFIGSTFPRNVERGLAYRSYIELFIGGVKRDFSSSQSYFPDEKMKAGQFLPLDRKGGYMMKTTENGKVVFTYYSARGDELRFVLSDDSVCGRIGSLYDDTITCARIYSWKSPRGVVANFNYVRRKEFAGASDETDLVSVTNTLGLSIKFNYERLKDNGKYSDPVYEVKSVVASSSQLGVCDGSGVCSRYASYNYAVEQQGKYEMPQTWAALSSYTDTEGAVTSYENGLRLPANPSVVAIKYTRTNPYDPDSPLQVEDALGHIWKYSKDFNQNTYKTTTTRTDPLGNSRVYTFDPRGDLIQFNDENDRVRSWEYDPYGRRLKFTDSAGIVTNWEYDSRGNVLSVTTTPAGATSPKIKYKADYPDECSNVKTCNQPISTTDARLNVTSYEYDPSNGGVKSITGPAAGPGQPKPQQRYQYKLVSGAYVVSSISSCRSTEVCSGTADETKVELDYGANGLLPTSVKSEAGNGLLQSVTLNAYDAFGNLIRQDGPLAGNADTTYRMYDRAGRLIGDIKPDPDGSGEQKRQADKITYDAEGKITTQEIGNVQSEATDLSSFVSTQRSVIQYNINRQKVKETLEANGRLENVTQYSYDAAGQLDCTAVRMNRDTWASLPSSACALAPSGVYGPDRVTRRYYNADGNLQKKVFGYGTVDETTVVQATYTTSGRVQSLVDGKGNTTSYSYDGFGRLYRTTFHDGTYEQYGYDANSNRTSKRNRDGVKLIYDYDMLNRVAVKHVPSRAGLTAAQTRDVYYGYDLLGHLLYARFDSPVGEGITNQFDALGRLDSTTNNMGGKSRTLSFQRDANGARTRITHPDGTYFRYNYDALERLTVILQNGSVTIASIGYDNLGRRSKETRGAVVTSYGYDGISRLSSLADNLAGTANDVTTTFDYNPANQIASQTRNNDAYAFTGYVNVNRNYTANGLNQYTTAGSASFGYDANGNLTSDGSSSYTYDVENRLLTASGRADVTLSYDPMGRLFQASGPSGTTQFLYSGNELVAEYATNGTLLRRYVHGSGDDDPLIWYEGAGLSDRRSLQINHQGSIVSIANSVGNAITINRYDEYGIPASSNEGRFEYTGQAWLDDLGMYYYKARIYSPTLGRFLQTDPMGYADSMNSYSYVGSDPTNLVDPTGMYDCDNRGPHDLPCLTVPSSPDNGNSRNSSYPVFRWPRFDYGGWDALASLVRNAPINQRGTLQASVSEPQKISSRIPHCKESTTPIADAVASWSDKIALGSAVVAAITSETIVGGIGFGTVGLIAKGVNFGANIYRGYERYSNGDTGGLISVGASAVVSQVGGYPVGRIASAAEARGIELAVSEKGLDALKDVNGAVDGLAVEAAICPE